jgi:hypothetical protein
MSSVSGRSTLVLQDLTFQKVSAQNFVSMYCLPSFSLWYQISPELVVYFQRWNPHIHPPPLYVTNIQEQAGSNVCVTMHKKLKMCLISVPPVLFVTHLCWAKAVDLYFSFLSSSVWISLLVLCSSVSIFQSLHCLSAFCIVVDFGLNGLGLKVNFRKKCE